MSRRNDTGVVVRYRVDALNTTPYLDEMDPLTPASLLALREVRAGKDVFDYHKLAEWEDIEKHMRSIMKAFEDPSDRRFWLDWENYFNNLPRVRFES